MAMVGQQGDIEYEVIDAIIEKPIPFTLENGRFFYVYQPSLGISLLSSQLLQQIPFNKQLLAINQQAEIFRVCTIQRDALLRIIAIHTFKRRSDAICEERVQERLCELKSIDTAELATLVTVILSWDSRQKRFFDHYDLDKQRKTRDKITTVKKRHGNTLQFGGTSLYGTILDSACERYGWEYGYALWGVSIINLNMMLSDSVQSVYLTKEEKKEAHISTDGIYMDKIDVRDKNNIRIIQQLIKGN